MTANDTTMNVIIWIHIFLSWLKPLLEAFKFIYILKIIQLLKV